MIEQVPSVRLWSGPAWPSHALPARLHWSTAAKADHRSLTSLVEKLLTDYCREKGFLLDDD